MKNRLLLWLGAVTILMAVGCSGGAEGDPQVPAVFRIDSIVSENGHNNVEADMVNAEDGITSDYVTVTVSNYLKNAAATPSHFNDVTITGYSVSFSRPDGGTVFESFDGGLSQVVQVNETATFNVMLVRLVEKTSGALAGTLSPYEMTATVTLRGRNGSGQSVQATGTIEVIIANYGDDTGPLAPAIAAFSANKSEATDGDDVTVSWYISGDVYSIVVDPGGNSVNVGSNYPYGSFTLTNQDFPQTYRLYVGGLFGLATAEVEVGERTGESNLPVINVFTIQPESVGSGQSAVLSWDVSNATSVTIYPELGVMGALSGEVTVSPDFTTTYTLVAANADGAVTETADLTVTSAEPEIVFFTGNNDQVNQGGVIHLNWAVQGQYTKLELFPFYSEPDDVKDVTGLNSIVSEPVNADTTFVLTAYGTSTIVNSTFEVQILTTAPAGVKIQQVSQTADRIGFQIAGDVETAHYRLMVADGDQLLLERPEGNTGIGQPIRTGFRPVTRSHGYAVVQLVASDEKGHRADRYLYVDSRNPAATRLADAVLRNGAGERMLELNGAADGQCFLKTVGGPGSLSVWTGGQWVSLDQGFTLPVTDTYRIRKTGAGDNWLLLVTRDEEGNQAGRVLQVKGD